MKIGPILLIFVVWAFVTFWAGSAIKRIAAMRNVDARLGLRLTLKSLNPFEGFVDRLRDRAELRISWEPMQGLTFLPEGGEVINQEFLADRRQYRLTLESGGGDPLAAVELHIQFPYPVDRKIVSASVGSDGVTFDAADGMLTAMVSDGGEVRVERTPKFKDYKLKVAEMRSGGRVEVLIVLSSWRDPRGKTIPASERGRYWIPEVSPEVTYIFGHFDRRAASETVKQEFYAPFELRDDKTVVLGIPRTRPEQLSRHIGME